jgi:hypothetical protein
MTDDKFKTLLDPGRRHEICHLSSVIDRAESEVAHAYNRNSRKNRPDRFAYR